MAAATTQQWESAAAKVAARSVPVKAASKSNAAAVAGMRRHVQELHAKLCKFVTEYCDPAVAVFERQLAAQKSRWAAVPPVMEELKARARELGLWNLFLPKEYPEGAGLTNEEYAVLCEVMGGSPLAPEACNCDAPNTGNMEVLAKYGTPEQKRKWLQPLLDGKIRSVFMMTEPLVASSDARNIETSITRKGDSYVINGRKWWSSAAMDPRCKIAVVMGKTRFDGDARTQQSMILVPMDTPGVKLVRALKVFGYDDAPIGHAEVWLDNVVVPAGNLLVGEGEGFSIAQGRLGPGRIHHCMRAVGLGERALEAMLRRVTSRRTFGKLLAQQASIQMDIARSRIDIDTCRQLVLDCARKIDEAGARGARKEIAMIKVYVPSAILRVLDRAMQAFGGAGVSQDTFLARMYAGMRTLRLADGPDEVHMRSIAFMELRDLVGKGNLRSRL